MKSESSVRIKVYLFLLIVAVLVGGGYLGSAYLNGGMAQANSSDLPKEDEKKEEEVVPVELTPVRRGDISSFLSASANLRPLRQVQVLSQSEGQAMQMLVEEGVAVRQGDLLCRLDDTQLQIRLQSARQKLAQAQLQLEKAEIRREKAQVQIRNSQEELQRYQQLYDEELVSEREVAQLRYRLDELDHDERVSSQETRELDHRVQELKSEIEEAQLQISLANVKAPFDGIITERKVEIGQMVRKLDELFTLSSFSTLHAEVFVSEREAARIVPGQAVAVSLGGGKESASGRVARISPIVDQSTGTVKITVELKSFGPLFKPGAFVRVDIETDAHTGSLLVPKRAVLEEDGKQFVYVVEGEVARRQTVQTGYESQGVLEIVSGLSENQQVVTAGQGALRDGVKIRILGV